MASSSRSGKRTVIHHRSQYLWAVAAACAAVMAPIPPRSCCGSCEQPCCDSRIDGLETSSTAAHDTSPNGCPLCSQAVVEHVDEAGGRACTCQLNGRQDRPASVTPPHRGTDADVLLTSAVAATLPHVPRSLAVSREYLAVSLGMPIRPPRILFGVWRN